MKHILMNSTAALALLGACLLPICRASAPVLILPNGTMVNLNTGIATEPDGAHYVLSHASLLALEALQAARQKAALLNHPPHVIHKPIPHESGDRT